jgi:PTH1 family peptidyl-tRNA hydrolase
MVVDVLRARAEARPFREVGEARVAEGQVGGEAALFVEPLTFMNRSGVGVEEVLATCAGRPEDVVVVLDDVALDLGVVRVRASGSHGGHNGLRSLIDVLGTDAIPRVRVGIRKGEHPADLAEYVLSDFPEEDVLIVQETVGFAADAVECLVREGPGAAMNRFNGVRKTQA